MERSAEARLWHVLGMSLLAGGGLPLLLNLIHIVSVGYLERDSFNIGIGYGIIILLGFSALVFARVLSARSGVQHKHIDWIWTVLAWVAIPLGGAVLNLEWAQAVTAPASLEQKSMLAMGAFILVAGLLAVIGERAVQRIQYSEIEKAIDEAERRKLIEASHGPLN